jgi:putative transposase
VFFRRVLLSNPVPRGIVTEYLWSYPPAKADIPEFAHQKHISVKEATRVTNRAGKSHRPPPGANARCRSFAMRVALRVSLMLRPDRRRFGLPRQRMNAASHRAGFQERLSAWHGRILIAGIAKVLQKRRLQFKR